MKAVMIIHNQGIGDEVMESLDRLGIRGFTRWNEVQGRGTRTGEPHMGSHVWPSLNSAVLTIIPDDWVPELLQAVHALDRRVEQEGIRAFVWAVEDGSPPSGAEKGA